MVQFMYLKVAAMPIITLENSLCSVTTFQILQYLIGFIFKALEHTVNPRLRGAYSKLYFFMRRLTEGGA